MKLTWLGHSCFLIEKDGYSIVLDPYSEGSVPGLLPLSLKANEVICSHEHGDHNARNEVELIRSDLKSPFHAEIIPAFHDEVKGAKRGTNQITILSDGTHRIAHFGDLGCGLEEKDMDRLKNLDCLMIPVGGYYTIDAAQAAEIVEEIKPKHVIPMHYRSDEKGFGYDVISTVQPFLERTKDYIRLESNEWSIGTEASPQVIVLQPLQLKP